MSNTKYKNIINTPFDELSKSNQKKVLKDSSGKVFGWVFDNVVSEEDCKSIIDESNKKMRPSTTMGKIVDYRTSWSSMINKDTDCIAVNKLKSLISDIIDYPICNFEDTQVVRYRHGQYYKSHHDYFDVDENCGSCNQRYWTGLLYLNNVENGGKTFFPNIDFTVKPKIGRLVLWKNIIDGKPNEDSLHEALPTVKCRKWAVNIWVREKSLSEVQEG